MEDQVLDEAPPDLAIRKRLAVNIRRLASEQGLSITALARKSGASRTQLYNMQRYRCSPTIETLYLIAAALDTDISVLLAPDEPV